MQHEQPIVANLDKFKELILHISKLCEDHPFFGVTKLNKLLFVADFSAYAQLGVPITGVEYFKLKFGPAPRPMKPVIDEMRLREDLFIRPVTVFTRTEKKPIAAREANYNLFTGNEIELVDYFAEQFRDWTATQIVNWSHQYIGWRVVAEKEIIPYESIYWPDNQETEVTKRQLALAHVVAERYNLVFP